MTETSDVQLRRLLLRQLSPDENLKIENAIVTEDGVAERLRAEELDLLDDYAKNRLTAAERTAVEKWLLASVEGVASLRLARGLGKLSQLQRPVPPTAALPPQRRLHAARMPIWGGLLVAGIAAVIWLPWRTSSPPVLATHAPPGHTEAASVPGPSAAQPLIITLLADRDRGAAPLVLHLPTGVVTVRLQTEIPGPAIDDRYSVRIDAPDGQRQFAASNLSAHAAGPYRFVETLLPRAALGPGERTITLLTSGSETLEFRWHLSSVLDDSIEKK